MMRDSALKNMFRALRYRNFRLFFAGQTVSLVGTWMQQIAMSWLVYRITGSAFLLGVVAFSAQIPNFVMSPVAGVFADRWNKHRILLVTQALAMLQALVLAALTLTGTIEAWHIIVLAVFLGCVNSLEIPARQSFIVDMVEKKENLGNAIALNSLMFNAARLVGPSVAGIAIAVAGEGVCFLANGISFFAVIASLAAMKLKPRPPAKKEVHIMEGLREGFVYAFGFPPIRLILSLLSVMSLMGMSYFVLMPVFAKDVLGGGAETLGFLMASGGVGALVATLYLASRRTIVGLGKMIPVSALMFASGLMLFAISRTLWLSFAILAFAGFGMMVNMAACNTILQTIADDDKRGRVMSFYAMAFLGVAPFGSLLAGTLASRIGATNTLIIGSATCMFAAVVFSTKLPALRKAIHPIYRKMGIIPEVASGIGTVTGMVVPPED